MYRAIGSKIELCEFGHKIAAEYYENIKDLLSAKEVAELDNFRQHLSTSRLQHSINVSFYSFRIARFFRLNARAAARAGLLHDMYYYDFKGAKLSCKDHSSLHPELALKNARKITELSSVEEDIILSHMWPMTPAAPKHFEGYVVTMLDKGCAALEVFAQLQLILANKIKPSGLAKSNISG